MNESCNASTSSACPKVSKHTAYINLPVSITPYAVTGPARISCCGATSVEPFYASCKNLEANSCEFVVTQQIQIELPIEFGASVKSGEIFVDCSYSKQPEEELEEA